MAHRHSGRTPAPQLLRPHLAHGNQGRIAGCIQILNQQLDAAGDDTAKKQTAAVTAPERDGMMAMGLFRCFWLMCKIEICHFFMKSWVLITDNEELALFVLFLFVCVLSS